MLSDSQAVNSNAAFGLLGDVCATNSDCFTVGSICGEEERRCICRDGFQKDFDSNGCRGMRCAYWTDCATFHERNCTSYEGFSYSVTSFYIEIASAFADLCSPNPCHHNGTCEAHDGIFSCYCSDGFGGSLCQHDLNKNRPGDVGVASFLGGNDSFVVVKAPTDAANRIDVKLNLRILGHSGSVLYMDGENAGDFLSIAVVDR